MYKLIDIKCCQNVLPDQYFVEIQQTFFRIHILFSHIFFNFYVCIFSIIVMIQLNTIK